jgi:hypothetical protein
MTDPFNSGTVLVSANRRIIFGMNFIFPPIVSPHSIETVRRREIDTKMRQDQCYAYDQFEVESKQGTLQRHKTDQTTGSAEEIAEILTTEIVQLERFPLQDRQQKQDLMVFNY